MADVHNSRSPPSPTSSSPQGCTRTEKVLLGGLRVPRRAPKLLSHLKATHVESDPIRAMDWVDLFTLAVNEKNASGERRARPMALPASSRSAPLLRQVHPSSPELTTTAWSASC
jgi:hypothetical protein